MCPLTRNSVQENAQSTSKPRNRGLLIALLLIFTFAGLFKLVRQDISSSSVLKPDDFSFLYFASQAWLHEHQPFTQASVAEESIRQLGPVASVPYQHLDIFYPPTSFVPVLPFLVFPFDTATLVLMWFSLAAFLYIALLLSRGFPALERAVFIAFVFNFAPLHAGLRPRNITLLMLVMILVPFLKMILRPASSYWWFVLVGLAIGIKPVIGVPFMLLLLALHEWKRFWTATATAVAATIATVGWLEIHHIQWLPALLLNLHNGPSGAGANNSNLSFVYNGAANFRLLNLAPLVYLFTGSHSISSLLPLVLTFAMFAILVIAVWKTPAHIKQNVPFQFLALGLTGTISLLPVYTRFYGALVLLPLFAWLWTQRKERTLWIILLAGIVLFSLPVPQFPLIWDAVADYLHSGGGISHLLQAISSSKDFGRIHPPLWQEIISALPNIFVLVISVFGLGILTRSVLSKNTKAKTAIAS